MNEPRPDHTKHKRTHNLPSPVVPLYADAPGEKTPKTLVGYYNRRTGAIFTTHMNASKANINNKSNGAHLRRVRAAQKAGYGNIREFEETNNRKEKRSWMRKFTRDLRLLGRIQAARDAYYQAKEGDPAET